MQIQESGSVCLECFPEVWFWDSSLLRANIFFLIYESCRCCCQREPNKITLIVLCLSSQEPLRGRSTSWAWLTSLLSTTPRRKRLTQQKLSNTGWVAQEERKETRWRGLLSAVQNTPALPECLMSALVSSNVHRWWWCWPFFAPSLSPSLSFSFCRRLVLKSPRSTPSSTPNGFATSSQTSSRNTLTCETLPQNQPDRDAKSQFYRWPKIVCTHTYIII